MVFAGILSIAKNTAVSLAFIAVGIIGFTPIRPLLLKLAGFRLHSKATLVLSIALLFSGSWISSLKNESANDINSTKSDKQEPKEVNPDSAQTVTQDVKKETSPATPSTPTDASQPITESQESVIPDLFPVDVYLNLENQGFEITKDFENCCIWVASKSMANGRTMGAEIYSHNASSVERINASIVGYANDDVTVMAKQFLGYVAAVPLESVNQDEIRDWVGANISGGSKNFGPINIEIERVKKNSYLLSITSKK